MSCLPSAEIETEKIFKATTSLGGWRPLQFYVGHWIDILRFSLQHLNMILYYQIGDLMENFMLLRLWDPL